VYTADIDIGGTFTDGFFTRGSEVRTSKVLTTPHDLTECFLACLGAGAGRFGVRLRDFLRECVVVRLSTTLGTNTLIQRRGPKIGLLVTEGHERDLYGEGEASLFRLFLQPEMVLGIREEVDARGASVVAPDPAAVLAAVRRLVNLGARMIAVSFARSWQNPEHERAVRAIVRARYPEHYLRSIPLQLGHEVSSAIADHARTNTAALNAYLHTELARGLYRAEDLAREQGMLRPLLVVHAGGGCARVAKTVAVQTLSSGPAVAVSGAVALAQQLGIQYVVTADMGGTSLDIAVLNGAAPPAAPAPRVAGVELGIPMVDTESIGAGGGSIAKVAGGQIVVGPESAGSAPGPACYDKGGLEPTVTDANLILGFLDADRFLGGAMKLNKKRAEDVLTRRLARPLTMSVEGAAAAVRARINQTMAADIAQRLRAHGGDPSRFILFAFGGSGPLHASSVADLVGLRRVVGFPFGSVFSAFGSSTVDVRHQYRQNLAVPLAASDASARLRAALDELRRQAALDMRGEGFASDQVTWELELVIGTHAGEHRLSWPAQGDADAGAIVETLRQEVGDTNPERSELRTLVLDARAIVPHWLPTAAPVRRHRPEARETRGVRWETIDRAVDTPLYQLGELEPGALLDGPALIEAPDTSYAVSPGWRAHLDEWRNVVMERR
jgi:N-methylhydantoinase A/acetophenone carboxylase